ncbi:DsbA family oxidoreductase [Streptomyces sp. XH2]|uniref:DsbA family oxidoreductase n=1 Tax=Streptomyces sp. XH2 TaxID=3412483 RepID=UPI003C7C0F8B
MATHRTARRRVELILDLTCVHSYLGFHRFQAAVRRYRAAGGEADVTFLPFQVAPGAPAEGVPLTEIHRRDFGDRAGELTAHMAAVGARDGLVLDFGRAIYVNTFEAHRLLAGAAAEGHGEAVAERLFRAYFTEGADISDPATLARLAAEAGLPATAAPVEAEVLRAELARVRGLGTHAVPHFVFDGTTAFTGARSEQVYFSALEAGSGSAR